MSQVTKHGFYLNNGGELVVVLNNANAGGSASNNCTVKKFGLLSTVHCTQDEVTDDLVLVGAFTSGTWQENEQTLVVQAKFKDCCEDSSIEILPDSPCIARVVTYNTAFTGSNLDGFYVTKGGQTYLLVKGTLRKFDTLEKAVTACNTEVDLGPSLLVTVCRNHPEMLKYIPFV